MSDVIQLTHSDLLVERPFTDPDHIEADRAILHTMAQHAWKIADQTRSASAKNSPLTSYYPNAERWQKRTMLLNIPAMQTESVLTAVGFFGNKRAQVDPEIERHTFEAGSKLCEVLNDEPSMVCYMTRLLADSCNYANLVVMKTAQTIEEWRKNEIHQYVTATISPQYYYNVRIYSGEMHIQHPQQQVDPRAFSFALRRVKYFDYEQADTWHGVRLLEPSLSRPASHSPTSPFGVASEYMQ